MNDHSAAATATLTWTEDGRPQSRTLTLGVTTTRQRLGGVRRWWRCPVCGRRCRVLFALGPQTTVGCRVCLQLRYESDYRARARHRRFVALVRGFGPDALDFDHDAQQELDLLLAPRRRGVQRGRRVRQRAIRALMRHRGRLEAVDRILQGGVL